MEYVKVVNGFYVRIFNGFHIFKKFKIKGKLFLSLLMKQ